MELYLSRLPRVLQHLAVLLEDRGYAGFSPNYNFVQQSLATGKSIGEVLSCTVTHAHTGAELHVAFLDPIFDVAKGKEVMTSSYQLHGVLASFHDTNPSSFLIISYSKLSPDATKEAFKLRKRLQVLNFRHLAFCLSRHILVPKHTGLSTEEAKIFEASRNIDRQKLPHLKMSDPIRIWYGWPKDTIVRIDRPTGTVWRCVH